MAPEILTLPSGMRHPMPAVEPVHVAVKGRMRVRVAGLRKCEPLKRTLETRLTSDPIRQVTASTATGTALIRFDPDVPFDVVLVRFRYLLGEALAAPDSGTGAGANENDGSWHTLDADEALRQLDSAATTGLSGEQVRERIAHYGPNILPAIKARGSLEILLDQVRSLPVAMLAAGSVLSLATGGMLDAAAILAVIGLNAAIGYVTETKAERTISALTGGGTDAYRVVRSGTVQEIPVERIVPGDVLDLRPGMLVPADMRILWADALTVNEAVLTGESIPVAKEAERLPVREIPLADRRNMAFRGTVVTTGARRAVVVASGARTEIGRIQALVNTATAPETPMQRQLDQLGRQLVWASAAFCGAYFVLGMMRGYGLLPMLKGAVSLAVAAIPEGLPTLATTTLALGIEDLKRHRVLIRRLDAVEGLSAIQVTCFDKTGTLTLARMAVVRIVTSTASFRFLPGAVEREDTGGPADFANEGEMVRLLELGVLCSEATLAKGMPDSDIAGSPTETALVRAALQARLDAADIRRRHPRLTISYRAESRRYMTTSHRAANGSMLTAVKGNPDEVLALCRRIFQDGECRPLTDEDRSAIDRENRRMAADALRVLGVAFSTGDLAGREPSEGSETSMADLVWVGLVALADPVRPEASGVVQALHGAGVATFMITGDQAATARAIARNVGLGNAGDGIEIIEPDDFGKRDWRAVAASERPPAHVFVRVTPARKLRVVRELQKAGLMVAMTGDGVNDTPSLRAADIGIALGGGTDAALQTADVVLLEDNLGGLVIAIERGRATYDNIQRALRYLLATNLSEMMLMLGVTATGIGQPLTPMQLLWINLVTDVLPGLGLALEPPEPDLLKRPPRHPNQPMIARSDLGSLAGDAALIMGSNLLVQGYAIGRYGATERARAVGFAGLVAAQLLYALRCRSGRPGRQPPNPYLTSALGLSFAAQAAALFVPGLRNLFGGPISPGDIAVALGAGTLPLLAPSRDRTSGL